MKHIYFIASLLRSKFVMSGMRVGYDTSDSQPTVNRRSRLTSQQRHASVTSARVAQEWLKYAAMAVMLFTIAVGNVWGDKITSYTNITAGNYYIGATTGGNDYYLSVDGSSLSNSIAGTAVSSSASATVFTFAGSGTSWTIQFPSGNYLSLKNSKDNGKVQVVASASTFTASNQSGKIRLTIGSYSIQKNNSGTQFGSYGNTQTDIWLEAAAGGGGGSSCDECTYYVWNGSTWASIGTTDFDDVVLSPPNLPSNGNGAGNGCWTTDKDIYSGGGCSTYTTGNKFRYVPTPGGADPDADNKPGSGVCELYAVYFDNNGCLSTGVTAPVCARIWEEPDNLVATVTSSTAATLTWDAITGVSSYHVIVTKVSNSSSVFDGDVNTNTKSLTGLTAGTEYSWSVVANSADDDACDSNPTEGDNFTTCASGFTSATPTIVPDATPGKTSCEVLFDCTSATSYTVTLRNNSTDAVISGYNGITNTTGDITFSGLTASTTYRVEIVAHNACGENSLQGNETFTTAAATLYTVTFHNAVGSAPSAVTQATEGGTVSIPSASACEGWDFAGWKVDESQSETTTDPTGSGTWITSNSWPKTDYVPTGNVDLYAVFKRITEGGGISQQTAFYGWETADDASVWSFGSVVSSTTGTPRTGSNAGTNGSNSSSVDTWYIQYNAQLASPDSIVCYYTKTSSNTNTSSCFKIQTSTDGSTWTDRATGNTFNNVTRYTYYKLVADLRSYTNVYVRIALASTNAPRNLDDVTLYYRAAGGGTTYWDSNPDCGSPKTLTSIAITTQPTLNYLAGQFFSLTGGVVTATYSDESTADVTGSCSWDLTSALTAGTGQTVTVSYTEGTTETTTTSINVYTLTVLKKDNTETTISGLLSDAPAVSVSSITALSAEETGNSYTFKEWQISGASLDDASSLTPNIINVTGAVTVTAVYWKPITVKWYVPSGQYGATAEHAHGWKLLHPAAPDPEDYGCDDKVFYGWTRSSSYSSVNTPPTLVTAGTAINEDVDLYAVFAVRTNSGTPTEWTKTALNSVSEGTYLICTPDGYAFTGEFSSGDGTRTESAFSSSNWVLSVFNEDAPTGAQEVVITQPSTGQFKMYVAGEGKGYIVCTDRSRGHIAYAESSTAYWSANNVSNAYYWMFSEQFSSSNPYLCANGNTDFRNYYQGLDNHNPIVLLKKTQVGVPATYSDYSTSCACAEYQFHYMYTSGWSMYWNMENICFTPVEGATNNYLTNELYMPSASFYKVTWQGVDQPSYTASKSFSIPVEEGGLPMPFYHNRDVCFADNPYYDIFVGGKGRFHIYNDSPNTNKDVSYLPTGYTLNFGYVDKWGFWENDQTLNFIPASSNWDETEWSTERVTLTDEQIDKKMFVGLQTETSYVKCSPYSEEVNLSGLRTKTGSGDSWLAGGMTTSYPNKTGKFRIYATSGNANWDVAFVPYYHLVYDANGGNGAPVASDYVSCEETAANRTVAISATEPTRANYRFAGWATTSERAAAGTVDYKYGTANDEITLTGEQTLYAVWRPVYTVTYAYAGGSGSCAGGSYAEGETVTVCASTPTKAGSDFAGWSYSPSVAVTTGTFTMPASNVTITATWTDHTYTLSHTGSNFTNTESTTTIKSSDTPLTLHYTCTGSYGFPNDVIITGGGKATWTKDTHYTWTVASDKKSATLVITPATTISANVDIAITMATVYTVTFVHHDKGTYSGASTEVAVFSNANTITLPTVTSVSCGLYDTFEGWIAAASEYSESTSKPATVYAGGSSYTVTGNVTLRALYSKCEGEGGQSYRKVTAIGDVTNGTYILVSNTATPRVYSGHASGNSYGSSVSGLTADGDDFTSTLPDGAVQVTVTVGTGGNAGKFAMYNGSKYLTLTTSANNLDLANDIVYKWTMTDGSQVNSKNCPAGALSPDGYSTRVIQCNTSSSNRFACYANSQTNHVFLYKLIDKCTKTYATNPSCVKPTGVHIVYNKNANDATMTCSTADKEYKVQDAVNKYPTLASSYTFCSTATRTGYTLAGWNTQANGLGTTYELETAYTDLSASGDLDGEGYVTLTVYAMWQPTLSFDLGNATGGTGVPNVLEADGGFMLPTPTAAQLGTIPCEYEFYGWSESSVSATTAKPASGLYMPGVKYTGSYRKLYAVYRLAGDEGNPDLFSLSYTVGVTKYYVAAPSSITTAPSTWNNDKSAKFVASTNAEDAAAFGMKTNSEYPAYKEIYWVYDGDEEEKAYMSWSSGTNVTFKNAEDTYYHKWTVTGTTSLTFQHSGGRYLSGDATEIGCPSSVGVSTFTKEEASTKSYTYATSPDCSTTATLAFVTNGGTLNYPDGYNATNYVDLTVGTSVYLPTASFTGEWVFEGWKKGSEQESQQDVPTGANFYTVTLNETTYSASPAGTTTFYAVYSKTVNDKQFDPDNEGTYKLFVIMADGTTKYYMPAWNGSQTTLDEVTTCASTGDYTITPGTGEHAGQYKITHSTYTLGVRSDGDTQFKHDADAWWNIEASTSGKGTYRITRVGSSTRAMCYGGTGFFGNYIIQNFLDNPSQPNYRDMEIGECIYTEYTSTPENIPYITITGSPVKVTSTNGKRIKSSTQLHIEAHNFGGVRTINLSATNGFATNPASVNTAANGSYSGDVEIYYQPNTDGDGSIVTSVLTATESTESVTQTFSAIKGRNMPANFVIAAKMDGKWYALPADCTTSDVWAGVLIDVDDADDPTEATASPNTKFGLREVASGRYAANGSHVTFTERLSTATANDQKTLYNGADTKIQVNAMWKGYAATNPEKYEWIPSTDDLKDYTLTSADGSNTRPLCLSTSGTFGTYTSGQAYDGKVRLLPATFYDAAPMQVLEWKANSVVVMYTGTETSATTQVGDYSASSSQTLSTRKLTHGVYELATDQALTSNDGKSLTVTFGATKAIVDIPIIITGNADASDGHSTQDMVIVKGGKLTAQSTKYSYHNIYVYGGGKLDIPTGTQLGVNNLILRAGGLTTSGIGTSPSATYDYVYPQVKLGGTLTSTKTDIKYEYITDYDHWYHLCLPFNGTLSTITYPQEYYGDNVTAANTGSWIIKRYAGEIRATGENNAWVDIESESATTVTAGHGYIFWGAPKKVTIGGDKQRQQWGIQRITMSTTAAAATAAETADKTVSGLGSYSGVDGNSNRVNDQGWNLIGNPYMANLTGLDSESLKTGKLVEDGQNPGHWVDNEDGIRYVTIPSDHFETYEAQTMSSFTSDNPMLAGRTFFVQIDGDATGVTFLTANRAAMAPAWQRNAEADQVVDVETGIVMSGAELSDEVDFWIKDGKTEAYESNADYPKTPNQTNFNIYGVHPSGNLSWVAISPSIAEGDMAVGYQVPQAGDYILSLSEKFNAGEIESLLVTDHGVAPELTTDLMINSYLFTVHQAETNNERFTVSIKVREQGITDVTTDIGGPITTPGDTPPVKFIYDDKLYILNHGILYDATGKRVNGTQQVTIK